MNPQDNYQYPPIGNNNNNNMNFQYQNQYSDPNQNQQYAQNQYYPQMQQQQQQYYGNSNNQLLGNQYQNQNINNPQPQGFPSYNQGQYISPVSQPLPINGGVGAFVPNLDPFIQGQDAVITYCKLNNRSRGRGGATLNDPLLNTLMTNIVIHALKIIWNSLLLNFQGITLNGNLLSNIYIDQQILNPLCQLNPLINRADIAVSKVIIASRILQQDIRKNGLFLVIFQFFWMICMIIGNQIFYNQLIDSGYSGSLQAVLIVYYVSWGLKFFLILIGLVIGSVQLISRLRFYSITNFTMTFFVFIYGINAYNSYDYYYYGNQPSLSLFIIINCATIFIAVINIAQIFRINIANTRLRVLVKVAPESQLNINGCC